MAFRPPPAQRRVSSRGLFPVPKIHNGAGVNTGIRPHLEKRIPL